MSTNSIEKADIVHQESVLIDMPMTPARPLPSKQKVYFTPRPTTELVEFQKTMLGPAIGFAAFGMCSFVLGLLNAGIITNVPYVAVGIAFSYGAIGQFTAGIIEIFHKNTFSAASFFTFAGFFLAYGIMFIPSSGILAALSQAGQLEQTIGLFSLSYAVMAFIFFIGTWRQPILIRMILGLTFCSYLLSAIGAFTGVATVTVVGGWFSFTLGLVAFYTLATLIYNETNTVFTLPLF
ncbi:unnamed protein product [Mucor hiemalis]